MKILLIETATSVCSVVLAVDGKVVAARKSAERNAHSSKMAVFINELMEESGITPKELDAVGVSCGPGSYTGLRIGASSAKGFCYALNIPLVAVPTLREMAALYYKQHPEYKGMICPMIDARRMECYTAVYDGDKELKKVSADIITEGIYDEYLNRGEVMFIGDGAAKTKDILGGHKNARYDESFEIGAEGMIEIVEQKLKAGETEDVAYFEPFYLKDFVAKKSVVRGLH